MSTSADLAWCTSLARPSNCNSPFVPISSVFLPSGNSSIDCSVKRSLVDQNALTDSFLPRDILPSIKTLKQVRCITQDFVLF